MKSSNLLILLLVIFNLVGCNSKHNQSILSRLQQWDEISDDNPEALKDSLGQINPVGLSRFNKAYHGLLKTIADDKNFALFSSDSLINESARYFKSHQKGSELHIRSLIYQGIVRYRMGTTDSIAFVPLKDAERLYANLQPQTPQIGYLMYYYLGKILEKSDNDEETTPYYKKALAFAKLDDNKNAMFHTCLALFWNEMVRDNHSEAKLYLDSIGEYTSNVPDNLYMLNNAIAAYFGKQEDYAKKLSALENQVELISLLKEKPKIHSLYYSISDVYLNIERLDSAMHYALSAIECAEDTLYQYNYLLFENVADIAELQSDFETANEYRARAAESYKQAVDRANKIQILELEKKYSHAAAENKALRAQVVARTMYGIITALCITLAMLTVIWRRHQRVSQLEKSHTEEKLSLLKQQAEEKRRMISIVLPYLSLHASVHNQLLDFTNITRAKDSRLADRFDDLMRNNRAKFNETTQNVFTDDFISDILGVSRGLEILNPSDRLLLFMLTIEAENEEIVALLNTTPTKLKSRKSYLKKKIQNQADRFDHPGLLLSLF